MKLLRLAVADSASPELGKPNNCLPDALRTPPRVARPLTGRGELSTTPCQSVRYGIELTPSGRPVRCHITRRENCRRARSLQTDTSELSAFPKRGLREKAGKCV